MRLLGRPGSQAVRPKRRPGPAQSSGAARSQSRPGPCCDPPPLGPHRGGCVRPGCGPTPWPAAAGAAGPPPRTRRTGLGGAGLRPGCWPQSGPAPGLRSCLRPQSGPQTWLRGSVPRLLRPSDGSHARPAIFVEAHATPSGSVRARPLGPLFLAPKRAKNGQLRGRARPAPSQRAAGGPPAGCEAQPGGPRRAAKRRAAKRGPRGRSGPTGGGRGPQSLGEPAPPPPRAPPPPPACHTPPQEERQKRPKADAAARAFAPDRDRQASPGWTLRRPRGIVVLSVPGRGHI